MFPSSTGSGPWRGCLTLSLATLCLAGTWGTTAGQDADVVPRPDPLALFLRGPHVGPADQATVGIEVVSATADDAARQVRRGCGLLLRCDGFVLVPASLFSRAVDVSGQIEDAGRQSVSVTLAPGSESAVRARGRTPRFIARGVAYVVLKVDDQHAPAARVLLPSALKTGDALEIAFSQYDARAGAFGPVARARAQVGEMPDGSGDPMPRRLALSQPVAGVPLGAVVVGPAGTAVGLVTAADISDGACTGFSTLADLERVTNCVTALSRAPGGEAAADAPGPGDGAMVPVPGGPVRLPPPVVREQPDMQGRAVACVAPFEIDRLPVTNAQYLAYWRTLPDRDLRRLGFRVNYRPATWAETDPPFPEDLSDYPVLGVAPAGAAGYARWRGKRLPTPYEWLRAAFGPDGGAAPPDWVRQYTAERTEVWRKVAEAHLQFLRERPGLAGSAALLHGATELPWIESVATAANATAWSRSVVDGLLGPLRGMWRDPLAIQPVGSRAYDAGPTGVMDVALNGATLVASYPGMPARGGLRYIEVAWVPARTDVDDVPFTVRTVEMMPDARGYQPLSRLYRRSALAPSLQDLVTWSNLFDTTLLLQPVAGWQIRMDAQTVATAVVLPLQSGPIARMQRAVGYRVWQDGRALARREMGRPVPLDRPDTHTPPGADLFYYLPVGFRCAR